MPGAKTNERPGTRAVLRHSSISASKARQVLDLIRGEDVDRAAEILRGTTRLAAVAIAKVLASAVANAAHNDGQDPEDLYVSACFADESTTLKRWRPRARGRPAGTNAEAPAGPADPGAADREETPENQRADSGVVVEESVAEDEAPAEDE